jgi:hypothetical protein
MNKEPLRTILDILLVASVLFLFLAPLGKCAHAEKPTHWEPCLYECQKTMSDIISKIPAPPYAKENTPAYVPHGTTQPGWVPDKLRPHLIPNWSEPSKWTET